MRRTIASSDSDDESESEPGKRQEQAEQQELQADARRWHLQLQERADSRSSHNTGMQLDDAGEGAQRAVFSRESDESFSSKRTLGADKRRLSEESTSDLCELDSPVVLASEPACEDLAAVTAQATAAAAQAVSRTVSTRVSSSTAPGEGDAYDGGTARPAAGQAAASTTFSTRPQRPRRLISSSSHCSAASLECPLPVVDPHATATEAVEHDGVLLSDDFDAFFSLDDTDDEDADESAVEATQREMCSSWLERAEREEREADEQEFAHLDHDQAQLDTQELDMEEVEDYDELLLMDGHDDDDGGDEHEHEMEREQDGHELPGLQDLIAATEREMRLATATSTAAAAARGGALEANEGVHVGQTTSEKGSVFGFSTEQQQHQQPEMQQQIPRPSPGERQQTKRFVFDSPPASSDPLQLLSTASRLREMALKALEDVVEIVEALAGVDRTRASDGEGAEGDEDERMLIDQGVNAGGEQSGAGAGAASQQPAEQQGHRASRKSKPRKWTPMHKALQVELAQRKSRDRETQMRKMSYPSSKGDARRRKRQQTVGGDEVDSSKLTLGAHSFAQFFRLLELVLDGLESPQPASKTKRDIFYRDVGTFSKQRVVDAFVDDLAATLAVPRSSLLVCAASKGVYAGALKLKHVASFEQTAESQKGAGGELVKLVPPLESVREIDACNAELVLVVEKEVSVRALARELSC